MKISKLSFHKLDNIEIFRRENLQKIKSEKSEDESCVYFKLKNGSTEIVRDFCDYKIDDQNLSELFCQSFWHNKKSKSYNPDFAFSYHWTGYIGSFNKFWQRIKILSFMRKKFTKEELLNEEFVQNNLANVKAKYHEQLILDVLEEFENPKVPLYGCRICGDRYCGTLWVNIDITNHVTWTFPDEESQLKWFFDKEQYESTLMEKLKSI